MQVVMSNFIVMKKKLYILLDCRLDNNDKSWLSNGLKVEGFQTVTVGVEEKLSQLVRNGGIGRIRNYLLQVKQVWKTLRESDRNDVIIVWYSVTGLIMNLFSYLFGGRKLILMNFLTPDKRRGLSRWITKKAVNNPNNSILVNTKESIEQYRAIYNLVDNKGASFHYFPDVYDDVDSFVSPHLPAQEKRYFFTGGMSNRDWKLICQIASYLPDQQFVCCALQSDFEECVLDVPNNVKVHYNLPPECYCQMMKDSFCVLLPLRTQSVAGLINILKSFQMGLLCCVSETPATQQYYPDDCRQYIIEHDIDAWVNIIKQILILSDEDYQKTVISAQNYIQSNFSPASALLRIKEIVK